MKPYLLALGLATPVWIGCAASLPEVAYTPPDEHLVTTVIHLEEPLETVWDRLMARLSRGDFKIEKATESEGLIVVSLHTNASHEYVDCGSVAYGTGKEIKVARSMRRKSRYSTHYRDAFLAGTIYITVERAGDRTLVSLKPFYDVSVNASIAKYHGQDKWVTKPRRYDSEGNVISVQETRQVESRRLIRRSRGKRAITFVTNSPNQVNWGTDEKSMYVNCCSTGKLEQQILALARDVDKHP